MGELVRASLALLLLPAKLVFDEVHEEYIVQV